MKPQHSNRPAARPPLQMNSITEHATWMLDLANDTIMIRNLKDEIIYWNHGAEQLYGWSKEEAIGKYVHVFLNTTFPEPLERIFQHFLETGHWDGILEHSKKNGERITVASRWTLQRDDAGKPLIYLEINNDITARVRAEQGLQKAHAELEKRVAERTMELRQANLMLVEQIAERRNAEKALRALSLRLISAQEEERRRISRDLHDDLGQILVYLSMDLERALSAPELAKKNELIRKVLETNREAHHRLGELSSLLRPPVLDDVGIRAAIHTYVSDFSSRTGIEADLHLDFPDAALPETVSTTAYRILQESLTNVTRHSAAKAVVISLKLEGDGVVLRITDDGVGFDPRGVFANHGHGISGMQERAELLGGSLEVITAPGKGTGICVFLPVHEEEHV